MVGSNAAPLTNTARPTISRRCPCWSGAHRERGHVDRKPDVLLVPVAALQHRRDHLPRRDRGDGSHVRRSTCRSRLPAASSGRRTKDERSGTATSIPTAVVQPTTPVTNKRPTLRILKVTFLGAKVYVRFRVCDDTATNLGILVRETRPGVRPALSRFATRVPPRPCGAYTRSWLPAQRFRGPGRYTITLRARDVSGLTSAPAAADVPSLAHEAQAGAARRSAAPACLTLEALAPNVHPCRVARPSRWRRSPTCSNTLVSALRRGGYDVGGALDHVRTSD